MKYSILQKKIICEKRKNLYELRDDQDFIDEEILQGKVENYNMKVKLAEAHNACKQ